MNAPVAVAVSAPRAHAITQRFPGNVRLGLFEDLLGAIWSHLQDCLLEPLRVEETENERRATFMAAVRFTVDKCSGQVTVSQLTRQRDGTVAFQDHDGQTVINLPVKLDGFWLDAFLIPWRDRIGECFIDHMRPSRGPDWLESIKIELVRTLARTTNWYRLRCELRDALRLDPQIMLWCRKGRPTYRDFVTQVHYNQVLANQATYQSIHDDDPDLVWLYNFLRAGKLHPLVDQPVAGMKAWLLAQHDIGEAGWRFLAHSKEQDFRHIIEFVDEHGGINGRHTYLAKWVRMMGKLRRRQSVPRPLSGLFEHDTYEGFRTEAGDRVRFRDVILQPGVLRSILEEGERRLKNGSHRAFMEEDVVEVMTWLQTESPCLDKNQLRQGWRYLAERAVAWRVECEAYDTLSDLTWESVLPETQIGPWRIVPITDAWQLRREAITRRHCADQHLEECQAGICRHFSVRSSRGKRVATIGIERAGEGWKVFGFRGFANRPVREELRGLDRELLQRYTDLWRLTVTTES